MVRRVCATGERKEEETAPILHTHALWELLHRSAGLTSERPILARGFQLSAVTVSTAFRQGFDVCYVFAFPADPFLVVGSASPLPLHAIFVLTSLDLLFVFLLVRTGFVYVWH